MTILKSVSTFAASLAWSVGFMIATWFTLILIQSVIMAHFQSLSVLVASSRSLSWILLGIIGMSGLFGLVLGGLGKLPGTR